MNRSQLLLFLALGMFLSGGNISWSSVLSLIVVLGLLFLVFLYVAQETMLYQPRPFPQYATPEQNPPGYRNPGEGNIPYEDVYLTTSDGIKLHCWFLRPADLYERSERKTLLFYHANAGNMGFRLDNLRILYEKLKINIFIISYRGYGNSTGTPSEKGLILDGETALNYLLNQRKNEIDLSKLYIFGRSLGGAVGIAIAEKYSQFIRGLILENTFTSIEELTDHLFPFLSFIPPLKQRLLRLSWKSVERIPQVSCPILFLSGEADEVVPSSHMKRLFTEAISAKEKKFFSVANGTHNTTWQDGGQNYLKVFQAFLEKYVEKTEKIALMEESTAKIQHSENEEHDNSESHETNGKISNKRGESVESTSDSTSSSSSSSATNVHSPD